MAQLTWDDYKQLRTKLYRRGYGKEELKALSRFPNKNEIMSMFQAIEDWFTTGFTGIPSSSLKSAIATGLGQSVTNNLVFKVTAAWSDWKNPQLIGG